VRQPDPDSLHRDVGNQPFAHRFGLILGFADEDLGRPDDADLFRVPPAFAERCIHVVALLHHEPDTFAGAEYVIDKPCRGPYPALRATGLDQHRMSLRRRHDAERSLYLKKTGRHG